MTDLLPINEVGASQVEALLDAAFGADRRGRTAYLLRQGMTALDHLSFAMMDGRDLVGSIQCWPIAIGAAPLILVGPVAVLPARQQSGIGRQLMGAMLQASRHDDPPMIMIGDPEYYGRFGFTAAGTAGWTLPGPWEARRLLLRNPRSIPLPQSGMLGPRTLF